MKLSRRQFIRTAAMFAGPTILSSGVLRGASAPTNRVNVGLIGCGGRGLYESSCYLRSPSARIVAVCDPWESKRLRAKQIFEQGYAEERRSGTYKGCEAYADFREVLARPDVDAVYIATPDHWHVPITIAAARAGKDVHCEKPLGVCIQWDLAARDAIRRYGCVFQYGAERRSTASARHAVELVLNGYIGEVKEIYVVGPGSLKGPLHDPPLPVPPELDYELWLGPAAWAPFSRARCMVNSGIFHIYDYTIGFIAGWAAHPLDQVQWWADQLGMGIPVTYEGTGRLPEDGLFDCLIQWNVHCKYASGLTIHFMDNQTAQTQDIPGIRDSNAATFVGTHGWVCISYTEIRTEPTSLRNVVIGPNQRRLPGPSPTGGYGEAHHMNWIECVRSRRDPDGNIESAVRSDLISHLSDIAVRTGRKIRWDPVRETIVGDEQAIRMMNRPMREPWTL
ncbi:MAG: Gfo/Idh/MocA family oxidoreductase [Verrucomicrobiae bacterium]|nr:Gfo/Idh/MocA family oxidoreductase [Verrucomicrobiae bacterium]